MRQLPESLAAEAALVASAILDPTCIADLLPTLDRTAFFHEAHQILFDVIVALYEKNGEQGLDGFLVRDELERRNQIEEIGGWEYLQRVIESVPSAANAAYYADIVREHAWRRMLIVTAREIADAAYDPAQDVREAFDAAQSRLLEVSERGSRAQEPAELPNLLRDLYSVIEKRQQGVITGLATGFYELDDMTGGLQPGEMIVVAGRPSMGKTALALNIADHVARIERKCALVFSLEMGREQIAARLLCAKANVDMNLVRKGMVSQEAFARLLSAMQEYQDVSMLIYDEGMFTPLEIRAMSRRVHRRRKLDLIIVDYVQLMHSGRREENRQLEISAISRHLKGLARELNVPVIAVSQLNRGPEARENKRPRMSDLRESGSLEQDADVVLLMYRDDFYHVGEKDYFPDHTAEVNVAKQRNGPTGLVELIFQEKIAQFQNKAQIDAGAVPF